MNFKNLIIGSTLLVSTLVTGCGEMVQSSSSQGLAGQYQQQETTREQSLAERKKFCNELFKRAVNKSYIFDGYWVDPETNIVYTRINCQEGRFSSPEEGKVIKLNTPYSVTNRDWNTAEYEWVIEGDLLVRYRKDDGKITKKIYSNSVEQFITKYLNRVNRSHQLVSEYLPNTKKSCELFERYCTQYQELQSYHDRFIQPDISWRDVARNEYLRTGGKMYKALKDVNYAFGSVDLYRSYLDIGDKNVVIWLELNPGYYQDDYTGYIYRDGENRNDHEPFITSFEWEDFGITLGTHNEEYVYFPQF